MPDLPSCSTGNAGIRCLVHSIVGQHMSNIGCIVKIMVGSSITGDDVSPHIQLGADMCSKSHDLTIMSIHNY